MFFSKRSKAPEKILNALLEERKSLTELSKLLDISKQALLKHTNQLEQQGLINSKSSEGKGGEKLNRVALRYDDGARTNSSTLVNFFHL